MGDDHDRPLRPRVTCHGGHVPGVPLRERQAAERTRALVDVVDEERQRAEREELEPQARREQRDRVEQPDRPPESAVRPLALDGGLEPGAPKPVGDPFGGLSLAFGRGWALDRGQLPDEAAQLFAVDRGGGREGSSDAAA